MIKDQVHSSVKIYASVPVSDKTRCRYCGLCSGYCPEKAIQFNRYIPSVTLIVSKCIACGSCVSACTRNGIRNQERLAGEIVECRLGDGFFIAGRLDEASQYQIPLANALISRLNNEATVICDFGPGVDTHEIPGITAMNMAVVVLQAEPLWEENLTVMLQQLHERNIPAGLILNKVKKDLLIVNKVKAYCALHSITLLGIIEHDKCLEERQGVGITEVSAEIEKVFTGIWNNLSDMLAE